MATARRPTLATVREEMCFPDCSHTASNQKINFISCTCMTLSHIECINVGNNECHGVRACPRCRYSSAEITHLTEKIDALASQNAVLLELMKKQQEMLDVLVNDQVISGKMLKYMEPLLKTVANHVLPVGILSGHNGHEEFEPVNRLTLCDSMHGDITQIKSDMHFKFQDLSVHERLFPEDGLYASATGIRKLISNVDIEEMVQPVLHDSQNPKWARPEAIPQEGFSGETLPDESRSHDQRTPPLPLQHPTPSDRQVRASDHTREPIYFRGAKGTLLPALEMIPGKTLVMIRIEEIGLKDASQYIDPFLTITVKDVYGVDVTAAQDTPLGTYKDDISICFGCDAYLQKPLEYLPLGFAIFFEFKHYKPKKKSISTKCWSFIEKDEIKEGPVVVELYKKPTCYRRKKIHLFTVKPLYLHLKMTYN